MLIPKNERTPRYFGAVARRCGLTLNHCPYGDKIDERQDFRKPEWIKGFEKGRIE